MNTTGIFKTHRVEIRVAENAEPFYLFPFGDVHRFSPHCHDEMWREWISRVRRVKNALFLGMGDYQDLVSASERDILSNRKLHESTRKTMDDVYKKYIEKFSDEISFMRGNLIGLVEGNHYVEFPDGTTSTQKLCDSLGCKYLGASAFIRLSFKRSKMSARKSVDIWAHHGKGAARLIGGSLNRVQQMAEAADADIYLMGHDHKRSVAPGEKLTLKGGSGELCLTHRKQLFGRTGGFLKGYVDGEASYIADACMNPTSLGTITIELTPTRRIIGGHEEYFIDIKGTV